MAALLIWVEKNVSRTDVECVWKRAKTPKSDDILAKRVSVMTPSTSQAGIKTPVTQEVKDWTVSSLSQLGRFTGMWWILSPETAQTPPIKTWDGLVACPGFTEAEDKALYVLSSLAVTDAEKQQIERDTVFQAKNDLWMAYRKRRITASNFGLVLAAVKRKRYPPSLFKTLLGQYNFKEASKAGDWGITHEPQAKQEYTEKTGDVVQERGVFLSNSGLLGGSPDGTVSDECIIEVKCPWSTKNMTVRQAAAEKRDFFLQLDAATDSLTLKQTHHYWHQIQGNLHLTGASTCHLVVWTLADLVLVPVVKDPTWARNIDILETFYRDCFLPKILSELSTL
ncbi:uncharacterized protein LOC114552703 [Xyrichtys novacula]|uniref:Uncharacterized protein LOC114552703 n=1 Tax=Xyrichtys novacula TaxID=13765 RepID=A0AAV1FA48_XYRNO|nr:uncharacterized protein LOC114552703 [Xyrichtys novacula]